MCLPAIVPLAAGLAVSVGSSIVGAVQQRQAFDAQQRTARRQQEFSNREILRRLQQERATASEKSVDLARAQAEAQGRVQALSGAGVSGRSILALRQATLLQSKTDLARLQKQEQFAEEDARAAIEANQLNTEAKIDSLERPNYFATGLQILSAATDTATDAVFLKATGKKKKLI